MSADFTTAPGPDDTPGPDSAGGGQPKWLVPTLVGAVVVLLIALVVVAMSGGDDDDAAPVASDPAATDVDSTEPAETDPPATEPPATEPPATEPPATEPPATDPPATDPPATDPPATDPPPTEPTALPAADLSAGQASIAAPNGEAVVNTINNCSVTAAVGLRVDSAVAVSSDGAVYVIDIVLDEGAEAAIVVTDLNGQIGGFFFGQDGPGLSQWAATPVDPFSATDRLTLTPVNDEAALTGPINVSYQPTEARTDCATGFLTNEWTFAEGETPTVLDFFDTFGRQFAVLAECAGGLILSEGGTLLSTELESAVSADVEFPAQGEVVDFWSTPQDPAPTDFLVVQQGGGGDVTTVVRVESFETATSGNLTWTRPPTIDGGLVDIDCRA